jgi:rubredoxin
MPALQSLGTADFDIGIALPPLEEFDAIFQSDEDCMAFLWRNRFSPDDKSAFCPECGEVRRFFPYAGTRQVRAWTCGLCGYFLYPTAGTIFQRSSTPLRTWFRALQVLAAPGHAPARRLACDLGVTYTTALHMAHVISGRYRAGSSDSVRFVFEAFTPDEAAAGFRRDL